MNASEKLRVARADTNMPRRRSEKDFASWQCCTEIAKRDVRSDETACGRTALTAVKDRKRGGRIWGLLAGVPWAVFS